MQALVLIKLIISPRRRNNTFKAYLANLIIQIQEVSRLEV